MCVREVVRTGDEIEVSLLIAGGNFDEEHLQVKVIGGLLQQLVQTRGMVGNWSFRRVTGVRRRLLTRGGWKGQRCRVRQED